MARMKNNPGFLDFDAIDGRKALIDTVNEIAPENTCLVLDNGDKDPDDSYSTVSYEKGFTFLLYLERLVGTPEFEAFFRAYLARFASKTLTSTDFKDFFLGHFATTNPKEIEEIDWETWFYARGMPPVLPPLDQSMARASTDLADAWYGVDREGKAPPTTNEIAIGGWATGQITCFLDALQLKTTTTTGDDEQQRQPLGVSTLRAMNGLYGLAKTRNSEILLRYCQLAIAAEDESIVPIAVRFITTQGRMKFVRPLYKSLYRSKMGRDIALATFLEHKDIYHPIATKMIAIDLKVAMKGEEPSPAEKTNARLLAAGAAIAAVVGVAVALVRRSKRT